MAVVFPPRAWRQGYAQVSRDAAMLWQGLRGNHPPPLIPLPPSPVPSSSPVPVPVPSPVLSPVPVPSPAKGPNRVHVELAGRTTELTLKTGQTLLEAGLAAGLPMPFSCARGGCGTCKVKLREGRVQSEQPNCLTPDEVRDGYVLACVSWPTGDCRIEVP